MKEKNTIYMIILIKKTVGKSSKLLIFQSKFKKHQYRNFNYDNLQEARREKK